MTATQPDPRGEEAFSSSVVLEQNAAAPESLLASPDQLTQNEITQEIVDYHAAAARREEAGERLQHEPARLPAVSLEPAAPPDQEPEARRPRDDRAVVAGLRAARCRGHRVRPDAAAHRRAAGRADDGRGPRARLVGAPGREPARRDLAGERRGPLHPPARSASRSRSTRTSPAPGAPSPTTTASYKFTTIKPGAYPWKNHVNAWRPAHIHFSIFGSGFTQRLVTQMYFPGDPLFPLDPIYNTIWRQKDRDRLIGAVRPRPDGAGVLDGLPLRHRRRRPRRHVVRARGRRALMARHRTHQRDLGAKTHQATAGQTVGPFFAFGLDYPKKHEVVFPHSPGAIVLGGTVFDGAGAPIPDAVIEIWSADERRRRSRARAVRSAATTTPSPASAAPRRRTTAATSSGPATPVRSDGGAPFFAVVVFARGLPDKLHTRIYLPERRRAARRRPAAVLARRGRARYAHRDAPARRQPAPRHPAAGREGDRVPCLLTVTGPRWTRVCSRR